MGVRRHVLSMSFVGRVWAVLLMICGGLATVQGEWIHTTYSPAIQAEACSWGESASTLAGLDWSPYFPFTLNDLTAAWARTC